MTNFKKQIIDCGAKLDTCPNHDRFKHFIDDTQPDVETALRSLKLGVSEKNVLFIVHGKIGIEYIRKNFEWHLDLLPYFKHRNYRVFFGSIPKDEDTEKALRSLVSRYVNIQLSELLDDLTSYVDMNFDKVSSSNYSLGEFSERVFSSQFVSSFAYYGLGSTQQELTLRLSLGSRRASNSLEINRLDFFGRLDAHYVRVFKPTEDEDHVFGSCSSRTLYIYTGDENGLPHLIAICLPWIVSRDVVAPLIRQISREFLKFRTTLSQRRLDTVRNFTSNTLHLSKSGADFYKYTCQEINKVFEADVVDIVLLEKATGEKMDLTANCLSKGNFSRIGFPATHGYCHYCIKNGNGILVESTNGDRNSPKAKCQIVDADSGSAIEERTLDYILPEQLSPLDEKSLVAFPFQYHAETFSIKGVLKVGSHEKANFFNLEVANELLKVTELLGPMIYGVELLQAHERRLSEIGDLQKMNREATHLHFYKTAVSGFFHSIKHDLARAENQIWSAARLIEAKRSEPVTILSSHVENVEKSILASKNWVAAHNKRSSGDFIKNDEWDLMEAVFAKLDEELGRRDDRASRNTVNVPKGPRGYIVSGDADITFEIIKNLIRNASEATSDSGRRGDWCVLKVQANDDGDVVITAQDYGTGMTREVARRIFDYGFSTKQGSSNGVGLYFSRRAAEFMGGSLRIQQTLPGKGTTMRLALPLKTR